LAEEAKEKSDRDIVFQTTKKFEAENNITSTNTETGELTSETTRLTEKRIKMETEAAATRANIATLQKESEAADTAAAKEELNQQKSDAEAAHAEQIIELNALIERERVAKIASDKEEEETGVQVGKSEHSAKREKEAIAESDALVIRIATAKEEMAAATTASEEAEAEAKKQAGI
jgi:hypothetical protein